MSACFSLGVHAASAATATRIMLNFLIISKVTQNPAICQHPHPWTPPRVYENGASGAPNGYLSLRVHENGLFGIGTHTLWRISSSTNSLSGALRLMSASFLSCLTKPCYRWGSRMPSNDAYCLSARLFLRISKTCTTTLTAQAIRPNQYPILPSIMILSSLAGIISRRMQNTTVKTQNKTNRIQLTLVLFIFLCRIEE